MYAWIIRLMFNHENTNIVILFFYFFAIVCGISNISTNIINNK